MDRPRRLARGHAGHVAVARSRTHAFPRREDTTRPCVPGPGPRPRPALNPQVGLRVAAGYTTHVYFGNYCTYASGGRTPGFWSNKNGLNTLMDGGTLAPEFSRLSTLHLVDANGGDFDPVTFPQFHDWLLGSTATNMAYKLSSHLAAMRLNVEAGYVNGNRYYAPFGGTVNQLMALADNSLASDPSTPAGHPERAYQEQLKDYLDALNNGAPLVNPHPCTRTFATPE